MPSPIAIQAAAAFPGFMSPGNTGAVSLSSSVTSGHTDVQISWVTGSGGIPATGWLSGVTVTDSGGTHSLTKENFESNPNSAMGLWDWLLTTPASGGSTSFTATAGTGSTGYYDVIGIEYPATSGIRTANFNTQYGGTAAIPNVSLTSTTSGDIVIVAGWVGNAAPTTAGSVGGTAGVTVINAVGDQWLIYDAFSPGGTVSCTLGTTAYDNWVMIAMALIPSGGGSSPIEDTGAPAFVFVPESLIPSYRAAIDELSISPTSFALDDTSGPIWLPLPDPPAIAPTPEPDERSFVVDEPSVFRPWPAAEVPAIWVAIAPDEVQSASVPFLPDEAGPEVWPPIEAPELAPVPALDDYPPQVHVVDDVAGLATLVVDVPIVAPSPSPDDFAPTSVPWLDDGATEPPTIALDTIVELAPSLDELAQTTAVAALDDGGASVAWPVDTTAPIVNPPLPDELHFAAATIVVDDEFKYTAYQSDQGIAPQPSVSQDELVASVTPALDDGATAPMMVIQPVAPTWSGASDESPSIALDDQASTYRFYTPESSLSLASSSYEDLMLAASIVSDDSSIVAFVVDGSIVFAPSASVDEIASTAGSIAIDEDSMRQTIWTPYDLHTIQGRSDDGDGYAGEPPRVPFGWWWK